MHRRRFPAAGWGLHTTRASLATVLKTVFTTALAGGLMVTQAQTAATPPGRDRPTLQGVFEAAWARQPEAQALVARRDAARAQAQAVQSWTPEPVALELATKTDRLNRNLGGREHELGLAIPLWLPGERGRSQALADTEGRALESRTTAARLRMAASVREAWWSWQRAGAELDAARGQLENMGRIAADVGKRLKAGDLARADQHQADAAVARAEAALAQAEGALTATQQQLRSLSGLPDAFTASDSTSPDTEPEPPLLATPPGDVDSHAELLALKDRAALAEQTLALAATQSRAHPELTLAATRDRGAGGDAYQQTFTFGLRFPLGAGPRHDARVAAARAEVMESQAQMALERARLAGEHETARARTETARKQVAAADRQAQLARELRGFYDKSFRLGETDLPTRLRIEADASDAERQAARARIEFAAAISAWRQALGLLPQ